MSEPDEQSVVAKRLARAEQRIEILERMLEDRTREAYFAEGQLKAASESLTELFRAVPGAIIVIASDGLLEAVNEETLRMLGYLEAELIGSTQSVIFGSAGLPDDISKGEVQRSEHALRHKGGQRIPVLLSATVMDTGQHRSLVCVAVDLTERKKLEAELLHAHKLESIGRLAAGVAHEINTPIQFISDSVRFAYDAIRDLKPVYQRYREIRELPHASPEFLQQLQQLDAIEANADVAFLFEQLPAALGRAMEGLQQVASIVRATKDFAYPTTRERRMANVNRALQSTLTIGKREYAEIADIELDLGELPLVPCHIGELNQVFLNLLINAAHAIQDRKRGGRGKIQVRTSVEVGWVAITIGDDGDGIPESIQTSIFDPFFTTKDVGRGSGQGLAIARSVVVERHGGSLDFETSAQGTRFFVRIPLTFARSMLPAGERALTDSSRRGASLVRQ